MRRGLDAAWDLHGKYSTRVFGSEAVKIIKNHTTSQPLFLYIAHAATHSANPYNPLPAPMETLSKNPACDTVSQRCNFAGNIFYFNFNFFFLLSIFYFFLIFLY